MLENTLIIFSSDNGPVLNDGYKDQAAELAGDHKPAGGLRGGKYSLYDGGTHIPLFVYWKGTVEPTVSDAVVCQMDLLASLAKLVGVKVKSGLDSKEMLNVFLGRSNKGRKSLIFEAQGKMGIRMGDWVMIPPYSGPKTNLTGNELGNLDEYGLFNVKTNAGQSDNVADENPKRLKQLEKEFFKLTKGYYKANVEEIPLK